MLAPRRERERDGDNSEEDREIRKGEQVDKKDMDTWFLNQLNRFMNLWGTLMSAIGRESKKRGREGDDSEEDREIRKGEEME